MSPRLALLMLIAVPAMAGAAPDFVPSPSQAYEGFVAINAPRPEVPVGALWIDGYGPTGSGASADNLETVRSLTGMVIDRNLQLSLSAGLFEMIGIDPRFRDRYSARFGELSIVRVKDVSQLGGPKGEPRIVEALKAGTVTVSTDGEIGLNARTIGWQVRDVSGDGTSGRTRSRMIEGRDLYIAMRVATPKLVEGNARKLEMETVQSGDLHARVDDYRLVVRVASCAAPANDTTCAAPARVGVVKLTTHPAGEPEKFVEFDERGRAKLSLPVPIADGQGGLFDVIALERPEGCGTSNSERCSRALTAKYLGQRLQDLKQLRAKGW